MYKSFLLLFVALNVNAQSPFKDLKISSLSKEVIVPLKNLQVDIMFVGNHDMVTNHQGKTSISKQNHDFIGYLPIDKRSDSGYVFVNHEHMKADDILGDGGGMTVFTAYFNKKNQKWEVANHPKGKFRNVDFSEVGGTISNCGGIQTPWGTVLTAEEHIFKSNKELNQKGKGIKDTSNFLIKEFNGKLINRIIPKYQNFNWMVEVDVVNAKAIRKNFEMGRYGHEAGVVLKDNKTVFLTDDYTPGFIYKFEAKEESNLSTGELYVYKQNTDGIGGSWLAMPMVLDSLINSREVAARMGATMFIRTEWAEEINGKIYFTETGNDNTGLEILKYKNLGATLSKHLYDLDSSDGLQDYVIQDYYGRILELDMQTGHLEVFLNGGGKENGKHLSNPDCLTQVTYGSKTYLVINEDLNNFSQGRVPSGINEKVNEIWWLDMSVKKPTVNDLKRFLVGPMGCETTGGKFTPNGDTYFVNIQHPDENNVFPYNNSVTIAVSGFNKSMNKKRNCSSKK